MTELALQYNRQGYNCSQCILKAFFEKYRIDAQDVQINMCSGISAGFGVGTMCGAIIGGIMVFSFLFDEETVKRLRIKLLSDVCQRRGSLNCGVLRQEGCDGLIADIAAAVENILLAESGAL